MGSLGGLGENWSFMLLTMEGSSEGEKKPPSVEATKIKRKMKTGSQLEILGELIRTYPSEALRAELSVKLGLSDRQLQMWFCHRRLKDRRALSVKRPRKSSPALAGSAAVNPAGGSGERNESTSGLGMGSNVYAHPVGMRLAGQRPGVAIARIGVNLPSMKRFYEPQLVYCRASGHSFSRSTAVYSLHF